MATGLSSFSDGPFPHDAGLGRTTVLVEAGLLHPDLLPVMVAMSRFDNLLVHDHARVDQGF